MKTHETVELPENVGSLAAEHGSFSCFLWQQLILSNQGRQAVRLFSRTSEKESRPTELVIVCM